MMWQGKQMNAAEVILCIRQQKASGYRAHARSARISANECIKAGQHDNADCWMSVSDEYEGYAAAMDVRIEQAKKDVAEAASWAAFSRAATA